MKKRYWRCYRLQRHPLRHRAAGALSDLQGPPRLRRDLGRGGPQDPRRRAGHGHVQGQSSGRPSSGSPPATSSRSIPTPARSTCSSTGRLREREEPRPQVLPLPAADQGLGRGPQARLPLQFHHPRDLQGTSRTGSAGAGSSSGGNNDQADHVPRAGMPALPSDDAPGREARAGDRRRASRSSRSGTTRRTPTSCAASATAIAPKCGGQLRVPTFLNADTKDAVCGEVDYDKLKDWALKQV